jgi:hypothetical protein
MTSHARFLTIFLFSGAVCLSTSNAATLVFSEDFNQATPPAGLTTGNTGFDGVVPSTGSINSMVSTIGTGNSARFSGATSTTDSGAYIVEGGLTSMTVMSFGFSLRMEKSDSGALGIYAGNGNTVGGNPGNSGRNSSHMLWDLRITAAGEFQYQPIGSNTWSTLSGFTVADGTSYEFLIQVNNSASAVDGVAANTMSIYANGGLIGSGLSMRSGVQTVTGFRMGARGTSSAGDIIAEIDDLRVWNGIQPIPEPTTAALLLGAAGFLLRQRRG